MKLPALRWLLDPATSLLALRLRAQERGRMSYDEAWRLARVTRHPDEMVYRHHGHLAEDSSDEAW
ncbi:hypothetical protein [Streptomyces rhizosphaericus]|uniref:Uncharacterized protein n=1 Tax=Streptomyces rhizosphaericus TaxID=114699 RepID=A0A6G4AWV1_9ACTN|nr:hypothetical protein [Streptomyces rhizosphaericus]NEW77234.1 hypothetical protein [Streptomyces rhizosphaericus]